MPFQIGSSPNHAATSWRIVGSVSRVVGLVCYALSSSFEHVFGEWNLLNIFLYGAASLMVCGMMLSARSWQVPRSLLVKAHVVFVVLMLTSLYSFFYDKAVNGKPDVLSLISSGAFALMSLSLSRQFDLGIEVGGVSYFLGFLTLQLMKIKLMLGLVAAVFCYSLIVLRHYSGSQPEITTGRIQHHVTLDIDTENGAERGADNESSNGISTLPRRDTTTGPQAEGISHAPQSRCVFHKRRDWNNFVQYLRNHRPPLSLEECSGAQVIDFLRYLDQFGRTKVHIAGCRYFGHPDPPAPCRCPWKQACRSLDAMIRRLMAAYDEMGGRPEGNSLGVGK